MQHDTDRPSTETDATPKVPAGHDVKTLVTPGDPAEAEAEAEEIATPGGEMPGANEADDKPDRDDADSDGKADKKPPASMTGLAG